MFKSLSLFRFDPMDATLSADLIGQALSAAPFVPCEPSQQMSAGWVPPRSTEGPFAERVGDFIVCKLLVERKTVPAKAIEAEVDAMVQKLVDNGQNVSKRVRKELKEEALHTLLPRAFPKSEAIYLAFDLANRLLLTDASTGSKRDLVITALVKSLDRLQVTMFQVNLSPASAFAQWIESGEPPAVFTIDDHCELVALDERKSAVKYARHDLQGDEPRQHVRAGKVVKQIALTWSGRLSFVATGDYVLKKLTFTDVTSSGATAEDSFDADVQLLLGTAQGAIADLTEAFGGELLKVE